MSNTVEDLMALTVGLTLDCPCDRCEEHAALVRAALTTALAEAEARGMERSASMAENYDLGTTDGHGIAEFIRAVAAEVGK